jgi:hypothetical protein
MVNWDCPGRKANVVSVAPLGHEDRKVSQANKAGKDRKACRDYQASPAPSAEEVQKARKEYRVVDLLL